MLFDAYHVFNQSLVKVAGGRTSGNDFAIIQIDEEKCVGCGLCGGIEQAVKTALQACGKMIPWQVVTISTDGIVLQQ